MSYRTIFTDVTDANGNFVNTTTYEQWYNVLNQYWQDTDIYLKVNNQQESIVDKNSSAIDNMQSFGVVSNSGEIGYNDMDNSFYLSNGGGGIIPNATVQILIEETQPTQDEEFLNKTGFIYYHNRLKTIFADKTEFDALSAEVDEIISEGGEPNVIETVKVNGTALTPDAQKAVDVTVPTATSDLTNDGDGTSNFATEAYVDANGGKIDVIKVNGTAQTITNKEVDLTVPTKTSDLTNDSNFITNAVNDLVNYYKKTETYTQAEIDALIQTVKTGGFVAVQTLPTASASTMYAIYLVPASSTAADDIKDEYITLEDNGTYSWEKIGTTRLDLSAYWAKSELTAITTAEIDQIIAS